MKKDINLVGVIVLVILFSGFYVLTVFLLDKRVDTNRVNIVNEEKFNTNGESKEEAIISNLYSNVKILYDVVNNKFKVDQEDVKVVGDITYKKIINFNEIMNNYFTVDGVNSYLNLLSSYFLVDGDNIYLAGNLVTYQTYYFRGDNTNIYIIDKSDNSIKAIVYEKWTSNNTNTLAVFDVVKSNEKWLINDISILATK